MWWLCARGSNRALRVKRVLREVRGGLVMRGDRVEHWVNAPTASKITHVPARH